MRLLPSRRRFEPRRAPAGARHGGPRLGGAPGTAIPCLLLLAVWLLPGPVRAAQAYFELDSRQLTVGQTVSLRLVVMDGAPDERPTLPRVQGLRFSYQGRSRSFVTVNFKATRKVIDRFAMTAVAPGTWQVGPLEIAVDDRRVQVPAVEVEVRNRDPGEPVTSRARARLLVAGEPVDGPVDLVLGQVVVYRFEFRHRSSLVDARWTRPEFEGFSRTPAVGEDQREYRVQEQGEVWTVHVIDVPLVASSVGVFEVGPASVSAEFAVPRSRRSRRSPIDDFFGGPFGLRTETRSETLTSEPVRGRIRPVPAPDGSPGGSSLVGRFTLVSELGAEQVRVGDSVTLTVQLEGDGTAGGFRLPALPDSDRYRVYDDEPESESWIDGGRFHSRVVARRAIVPTRPGRLEIPALSLSWYDPHARTWVRRTTESRSIEILPGEEGAVEVDAFGGEEEDRKDRVASLGEDILPIHAPDRIGDRVYEPLAPLPWILVGIPGLLLLGSWGAGLTRRRSSRQQRIRDLRRDLGALASTGDDGVPLSERLAAYERLFREAASLRTGVSPSAVDREVLRSHLPDAQAERAAELLGRLERVRFGGLGADDALEGELRALLEQWAGRIRR